MCINRAKWNNNKKNKAMEKKICILILTLFISIGMFAQDAIIMKNGDEIKVKITEVTQTEVKYKKLSYIDGPIFTIKKSDLLMIRYENGENEVFSGIISGSSDENVEPKKLTFTRGHGFFLRPEFYRGIYLTLGMQVNPYMQVQGSIGYGDGVTASGGFRFYTNDNKWAGLFDVRYSYINLNGHTFNGLLAVTGASYKLFDFGGGVAYYFDGKSEVWMPVITLGWNIRCYKQYR